MKFEEDFIFPVYITKSVIESIRGICERHKKEVMGYLVGELLCWKDQKYITIPYYLYIKDAFYSSNVYVNELGKKGIAVDDRDKDVKIEFNYAEYQLGFENLKKMANNENLWILGWWHSHPSHGCYLSSIDLQTQTDIFYHSYMVALVVDPIKDYFEFFTLDSSSKKGYKSLDYAIIS